MVFRPVPSQVLYIGLVYIRTQPTDHSAARALAIFEATYGAKPLVIGKQWVDLCFHDSHVYELSEKEKSEEGFYYFLRAHYFLWNAPKNEIVFATHFDTPAFYCRGKHVWEWVARIADLHKNVITFDETELNGEDNYVCVFDCVDFKAWEPKHPTLPYDKSYFTQKHNKAGYKYMFALSVYQKKCIMIAGPYKAGTSDIEIFQKHLKPYIPDGKKCICDGGVHTKDPDEKRMLSKPNGRDSQELAKFKARARARQESFNGRIRHYEIMEKRFCYNMEKHELACLAVTVTVQYKLNNGSLLFDAM